MVAAAAMAVLAIVAQDTTALRAAPSTTAPAHAQLLQGELLEVRGQRLDHLRVYDHRRERAGYVRASQVKLIGSGEADASQLLAVLRFLRGTAGSETLGIAYVAAYLKAVPASQITAEPFDALGTIAERLARRAAGKAADGTTASAHLEVAGTYGVKFISYEHGGRMQLCYDGEAFRRVLSMTAQASAEQRARAALALTRHDCLNPALRPHERQAADRWRAGLLDGFNADDTAQLSEPMKNRLRLRRAGVWAALAFGASRNGESTQAPAQRALDELAAVNKNELGDEESADYAEAAMRVGAVRWAAAAPPAMPNLPVSKLQVRLQPGEPGQTCVQLMGNGLAGRPLAERCTYATVWAASAAPSPDGRALALAVQPIEGWGELWVFRQAEAGWSVDVLPPVGAEPGLGYVEFAGWVPGTSPRLLVVREGKADGRVTRRFEVLALDTLAVQKFASTPQLLAAFGPYADAQWKRGTVSLR